MYLQGVVCRYSNDQDQDMEGLKSFISHQALPKVVTVSYL